MPRLVLSDAVWRRYFHADPNIAGHVVYLMGEKAIIAGVAKPDAWRLPGQAEAWLLETDNRMDALATQSMGFVVARIQPLLARNPSRDAWHMTVPQEDGSVAGFACVSVEHSAREPFVFFMFATLMALLALPATTSLPLGEYPYNPRQQSLGLRLRRWLFFTAKLALILPVVCFASLDVAQMFGDTSICATDCYICDGAGGLSLDAARSAAALPGLFADAAKSGSRWRTFEEFPGVEWHGADLRGGTWLSACAGDADKLVQYAAMAVSGCIVANDLSPAGDGTDYLSDYTYKV